MFPIFISHNLSLCYCEYTAGMLLFSLLYNYSCCFRYYHIYLLQYPLNIFFGAGGFLHFLPAACALFIVAILYFIILLTASFHMSILILFLISLSGNIMFPLHLFLCLVFHLQQYLYFLVS